MGIKLTNLTLAGMCILVGYVMCYAFVTRVSSPHQSLARQNSGMTAFRYFPGRWDPADEYAAMFFAPLNAVDQLCCDRIYSDTGAFPDEYSCINGGLRPGRPVKIDGEYRWEVPEGWDPSPEYPDEEGD